MNLDIFITLDYEIYFGANHGTVEKCIIYPTEELTRVADKHHIKLVQFVDIGFILKLDEYRKRFPVLDKDYKAIIDQLKKLNKSGHDIQLHIHPHWEDSFYDGGKWIINVERYKLTDFSSHEINEIVSRYKKALEQITGKNIFAYRAGGWCLQPFDKLKDALYQNGIRVDSSVFVNGCYDSEQYKYDFRYAPLKSSWKFTDNPVKENENGIFTEVAISSIYNSPLFYWRLFLLGRLNPHFHKPLGNGEPIPAPGQRFKLLTHHTHNTVSIDGYNASLLNRALRQRIRMNKGNEMVIIGHPKSLTRYGIKTLDAFIAKQKSKHNFTTFAQQQHRFL